MTFFFIIAGLVVFLDQLSKHMILTGLVEGRNLIIIKNIFNLTLVKNPGIAFGLFPNAKHLLTVFSFCAIAVISGVLWKKKDLSFFPRTALALVMGGAIGNLIDRLRWGYVVDFLDFRIWPVFNFADTAITIGVILLSVYLFRK